MPAIKVSSDQQRSSSQQFNQSGNVKKNKLTTPPTPSLSPEPALHWSHIPAALPVSRYCPHLKHTHIRTHASTEHPPYFHQPVIQTILKCLPWLLLQHNQQGPSRCGQEKEGHSPRQRHGQNAGSYKEDRAKMQTQTISRNRIQDEDIALREISRACLGLRNTDKQTQTRTQDEGTALGLTFTMSEEIHTSRRTRGHMWKLQCGNTLN